MSTNISTLYSKKAATKIASGLAAVSGYEPWPMRTIESMKESLADGVPILARLHSAADYPTSTEETDHKLDMESHAILLIGYDDAKEAFEVIDPWRKDWKGTFSEHYMLPYQSVYTQMVNCSLDKATRMALPYTRTSFYEVNDQRFVNLKIGFYRPRGYVLDEKGTAFTYFKVSAKFEKKSVTREVHGFWTIGEYALLSFPVPDSINGKVDVKFEVDSKIVGIRPYKYTDQLQYKFESELDVSASKLDSSEKESILEER